MEAVTITLQPNLVGKHKTGCKTYFPCGYQTKLLLTSTLEKSMQDGTRNPAGSEGGR